jgi:hypothetical protein
MKKNEFLRKFSRDLLEGQGAVFVGAGMSIPVGFVNWRDLLREIADDMGLDIEFEYDLVAVAQYEFNRKRGRDTLDEAIIRQFAKEAQISDNHRLLARLPVDTVWTTNYDEVLEQAFREAHRKVDVKHRPEHLRRRNPYADVTIFKMHGDVNEPSNAVITKDDYECYEVDREAFTIQLLSDLISKRFLFLGFSFSDPNLDYTFNRLRRILNPTRHGGGHREHYCILKEPTIDDYRNFRGTPQERDRMFELDKNRFGHRVEDLKSYGIQTVVIERYDEVNELLGELNRFVKTRTIMISGAAEVFEPRGEAFVNDFCRLLARSLIHDGFDVVSGVGKGISGSIMIGAEEELARPGAGRLGQRLRLFPFPYWMAPGADRDNYYTANRREMTSQGGITIVICGNKLDPGTSTIIDSPGVATEVELAREAGQFVIPVGATGHAARTIWEKACADPSSWIPGVDVAAEIQQLGDESLNAGGLVDVVVQIIQKIRSIKS